MTRTVIASVLVAAAFGCGDDEVAGLSDAGPSRIDARVGTAGDAPSGGDAPGVARSFVYVETNDPAGNGILVFERSSDGKLVGRRGAVAAGGPGLSAGPKQRTGPLDLDRPLVFTRDRARLYAVNAGGSSIAVFEVNDDGSLTATPGSPFYSGGPNPVSVGFANNFVIVLDKAVAGTVAPSFRTIRLDDHGLPTGGLDALGAELGSSPTVAYVSRDQRYLFSTQFVDGSAERAPTRQVDSIAIGTGGHIAHVPGSPYVAPIALGLVQHPSQDVLYVGFPTQNRIGVYSIAANGSLRLVRTVAISGKAASRFVIDDNGAYLYAVEAGSGSIASYDLTDPLRPVFLASLSLMHAKAGAPFTDGTGALSPITSRPMHLAFDADQSHLFVLSQRVTTSSTDLAGNYLHTVTVNAGKLAEPDEPIDLRDFGVSATARPQGVAVWWTSR